MEDKISKIISLCKRRGFIFPSSEIYGGFGGVYDFGPLGLGLKKNIKESWQKDMEEVGGIVGFDSAVLANPKVWEASGHLSAGFSDELRECKKCHKRFRSDEIENDKCSECGGELTKSKKFNLMLKTFIGPVEDDKAVAYLRPETCQSIFINFSNILNSQRLKIPFGVIQIGKSFRNEINPKNFIFRIREFEQMEMEWFCHPSEAEKWFEFWLDKRLNWYYNLGVKKESLRTVEAPEKERAHYAQKQVDIQYRFPSGWKEIEGIHNRGDWDLSNHSKYSGQELSCLDESLPSAQKEKYFPYVIETSVGVERVLFAFLSEFYQEVEGGRTETTKSVKEVETLLKLPFSLAPVKIAVFPLVKNKPELVEKAKEVYRLLKSNFSCLYDEVGSIGRRYRRADEIGVPWAVTIDFETLEKEDVTIRNRDTMKQERVKIKDLGGYFNQNLR